MIRELLSKASQSAKAARALLQSGVPDDAVSRAYYSAFNSARALIAFKDPAFTAKTHGSTLGAFSRIFVQPGILPKHFGTAINRAQTARQVADYENEGLDVGDAEHYVAFAEELFGKALELIPTSDHPTLNKKTPQEILIETREEDAAKNALAKAFCDLATKRGENVGVGLVGELSLYGNEETLTSLITDVDEMTDLQSFVKARVPVPSLG
jgi:uncharacterized protein (UPF0332 family)